MKKIFVTILCLVIGLSLSVKVWGQVNISAGNTVEENFNTIGTSGTATLPTGWKVDKNTTVRLVGSYSSASAATEKRSGNSMSNSAANGIYNFAAGDATSATDRAVGGISSSSASKSVNIYVQLKNNGTSSINNFTISYDVEKYRNGSNEAGFSIQMYYSTNGTDWTSAGSNFLTSFTQDADNSGYTSAPGETKIVSSKTLNQALEVGSLIYLAWNYSVTSGKTTSNAQALGIDNVSIYANGTPTPTIVLSPATLTGFTYDIGYGPSDEQTFSISGSNLTSNISLVAPTNYEISTSSGTGFASSLTLNQSGGTVSNTTIYVRLKAGLNIGVYNGENITASSSGASDKTVSCSGEVKQPFVACATDLIISEYIEGSSNNKYIEIYNGTNSPIDLADYKLQLYTNGVTSPNNNVTLSGTLGSGETKVYKHSSANLSLPDGVSAENNTACAFNGDDAVALYKISTSSYVDIFGRIGEDPGTAWTASGGYTTVDKTLRRKPSVSSGITTNPASGFPSLASEWDMFNEDDALGLGSHNMTCGANITINTSSLNNFDYFLGYGPSDEQTFSISGSNLTSNISLAAPTNYEISTSSGTGFTNSLTLNQSGGTVSNTTIYVRLKAGLSIGVYNNENITASSTGATSKTVSCSGEVSLAPVSNLSVICSSNTTAQIVWSEPESDYDGVVIAFRQSTNVPHSLSADPTTITASANFGTTGTQFGGSTPYSYVVYKGTGNYVEVTGLTTGQTYKVKAYVYKGTTWIPDNKCPTLTISNLGLSNVSAFQNTDGDSNSQLSWVLPSAACFDEVLILARQTSNISFTPSGDGTGYSPNSAFGSGTNLGSNQYVVYKGTGTSMTISALTNNQKYYAKIFVRKGNEWSSGIELELNPKISSVLEHGDLAILAVNTTSDFGDEFSFVCFKDIAPGTAIDFTDNGYERVSAGKWGDTEGTIRLTRKNSNLSAGKVISLEIKQSGSSLGWGTQANIYIDGNLDNTNWSLESLNGSSQFDLNKEDQLWIMQNGNWVNPSDSHDAVYTGNVLYGWTATGWKSSPNYADTKGSTIYPGCECANTNLYGIESSKKDKVKYTGITSQADKFEWIARINNPANWTGFSSNADYNAASPKFKSDGLSLDIIPIQGYEAKWRGYKSAGWCDCSNWYNLKVPDENTDVEISGHIEGCFYLRLSANPDSLAVCKDLIVKGDVYNAANASLKVKGNFTLDGGSVNFNTNAINFEIGGDMSIDNVNSFKTSQANTKLNGTSIQNINGNSEVVFGTLTIDKPSAHVVLAKNIKVSNINFIKGKINTGTNRVFIDNTATNAIGSISPLSYINGNLRRAVASTGSYTLPVGNDSNFELATVELNSSSGLTHLDARFDSHVTSTDISSLNLFVDGTILQSLLDAGYWTIAPNSGLSSINYDISLDMRGATNAGAQAGQHTVIKRDNSSSNWYLQGNHTNATQSISGGSVHAVRTGLTSFSEFSIAKHNLFILPVELISFEANCNTDFVELNWITVSETNNDYFIVQRSQDATNWKNLSKIQGAGFSSSEKEYEYIDNTQVSGNMYYRLVQVDFDGTKTISNIVNVNCINKFEIPNISIYPNPANDILNFSQAQTYEILDIQGRVLMQSKTKQNSVNISELKEGMYFIKFENELLKFIKN